MENVAQFSEGVRQGIRSAAGRTCGPDACAEEAKANVMIAGGNPDVYYELTLTTTSEECAGRADGDASDERERGSSWGSGKMTAGGDSGAGAAGSSARRVGVR